MHNKFHSLFIFTNVTARIFQIIQQPLGLHFTLQTTTKFNHNLHKTRSDHAGHLVQTILWWYTQLGLRACKAIPRSRQPWPTRCWPDSGDNGQPVISCTQACLLLTPMSPDLENPFVDSFFFFIFNFYLFPWGKPHTPTNLVDIYMG